MPARYFLEVLVPHAAEACNYLLAVDVDMTTVGGYASSFVAVLGAATSQIS